jgi:hypothetical protein
MNCDVCTVWCFFKTLPCIRASPAVREKIILLERHSRSFPRRCFTLPQQCNKAKCLSSSNLLSPTTNFLKESYCFMYSHVKFSMNSVYWDMNSTPANRAHSLWYYTFGDWVLALNTTLFIQKTQERGKTPDCCDALIECCRLKVCGRSSSSLAIFRIS